LLIEYGAKLDGITTNNRNTLLHCLLLAPHTELEEVLNYLIEVGALTTVANMQDLTPAAFAQQRKLNLPNVQW
jgi:hypothetical protein